MKEKRFLKKVVAKVMIFVLLLSGIFINCPQKMYAADNKVATVYIVSCKSGASGSAGAFSGHTFLVVKNKTDSKIAVGHYNLGGGNIMSIGSWGNISDGEYVYYNIEKYRMVNDIFGYTPSVYYKVNITNEQLKKLTKAINDNYTWTLTKNCSRFARYCWNSMFDKDSSYHIEAASIVETPVAMYDKIKEMDGYKKNFEFGEKRNCTMSKVFVHTSSSKENLSKDAKADVKLENN